MPFYSKIVYSRSVCEDDKTYSTFKKESKTPNAYMPFSNLMNFINEYFRVKMKYYEICKFLTNDFKEGNETMKKKIEKHLLDFFKNSRSSTINTNTSISPIQ